MQIMDTQPAPGNDDHIDWGPATNGNRVAYEVRVNMTARAEMSETKAAFNGKELAAQERYRGGGNQGIKDVDVNWLMVGDVWKDVDPNQSAYITRYSLHINRWSPIWDWKLEFSTPERGYYRFIDESGDYYDVEVNVVGDHYVRYNSSQPTIKKVKYRSFDSGVGFQC